MADAPDAADVRDDPDAPRRSMLRGYFRRAVRLAAAIASIPLWILVLAAGLALAAAWAYPTDLRAEGRLRETAQAVFFGVRVFQFHLGLAVAVVFLLALLLRRGKLAAVALVVAVPTLGAEAYRATPNLAPPETDGPLLRVAAMNIYGFNVDHDAIAAEVRRIDADLVGLIEYGYRGDRDLPARLAETYPFVADSGRTNFPGMVLLSKLKILDDVEAVPAGDGWMRAYVEWQGRRVAVNVVHHRSPGKPNAVAKNYRQAADLLDRLPPAGSEAIFMGDFNAATWTPPMVELRRAGLTESFDAASWGRGATWPMTAHPVEWRVERLEALAGIPPGEHGRAVDVPPVIDKAVPLGLGVRIDQIFVTDGLVPIASGVGREMGSDHLPVWADLRLRAK